MMQYHTWLFLANTSVSTSSHDWWYHMRHLFHCTIRSAPLSGNDNCNKVIFRLYDTSPSLHGPKAMASFLPLPCSDGSDPALPLANKAAVARQSKATSPPQWQTSRSRGPPLPLCGVNSAPEGRVCRHHERCDLHLAMHVDVVIQRVIYSHISRDVGWRRRNHNPCYGPFHRAKPAQMETRQH